MIHAFAFYTHLQVGVASTQQWLAHTKKTKQTIHRRAGTPVNTPSFYLRKLSHASPPPSSSCHKEKGYRFEKNKNQYALEVSRTKTTATNEAVDLLKTIIQLLSTKEEEQLCQISSHDEAQEELISLYELLTRRFRWFVVRNLKHKNWEK